MHTHASNSEFVEPLLEPERTMNQRLCRRNRRVPFEQRNNPPQHPRIVYPPILNINYFSHFLDILRNYDPMDDEPMWAADCVVAPTLGSAITILETANKFAIKEMLRNCHGYNLSKGRIIKIFYHGLNEITQEVLDAAAGGIFLYKTPNQAYQLLKDKVLLKLDWAKNKTPNHLLRKPLLSLLKSGRPSGSLPSNTQPNPKEMEEDSKVPLILRRPTLHTVDAVIRIKQKQPNLGVGTERMIFHNDSVMKHSYSNDDTFFSIDVIDEILEEDFDALLNEGSEILHSIKGTILEEKLFAEFDEFMAMNADENFESESNT
uniref:Reverse transcriptase domain-containing protein n=1 Tax=Tanacetum cinerariifolium TaxID=118510 RepID=A0A6L2KAV5_TANCI|nr:reverse transcriptase domain-containing protein [Tanacetum cinerariifolium]